MAKAPTFGKTIGEVLGPSGRAVFRSTFETAKQKIVADCNVDPRRVQADERNWMIERQAGRWQAAAWRRSGTFSCGGGGFDFPIDIELPPEVVGRHGGERVFRELQGHLPGFGPQVNDVHESPDADLFVATVGPIEHSSVARELLVFRREATTVPEKPLFRAELGTYEELVIVEWATGSAVDRWTATLGNLSGRRLPRPHLLRHARKPQLDELVGAARARRRSTTQPPSSRETRDRSGPF